MERDIYKKFILWKKSKDRKPMLLRGARQTGKTYILKKFGKSEYENMIYLDFDEDPNLNKFFSKDLNPNRIINDLSIYFEMPIYKEKTLLFFDEIQESPNALNSLKYFNEKANEYHIVSAGSLLGVKLSKKGFPVGKVNFMDLFPLNFFEFLNAIKKDEMRKVLENKRDCKSFSDPIHEKYIDILKIYYIVGGMPEAVAKYVSNPNDFLSIRKIQKNILSAYEIDFAKHSPSHETIKILKAWNSIAKQLAKENKKFMFSKIDKNARKREYSDAIDWLENANLILKSNLISTVKFPLKAYINENSYKIFLLDVGLLGAMVNLPIKIILEKNRLFTEFKGSFTENFVAQELLQKEYSLYYWSKDRIAEIDFILIYNNNFIPLEVKSNKGKNTKSLQIYEKKFSAPFLLRTSLRNFIKSNHFFNIPLYCISHFTNFLMKK